MTVINPTYRKRHPPTQTEVLDAHKQEIGKDFNSARIGIIQSFDAATQTASVLIAQLQVTSESTDGTQTVAEYPLLKEVPVVFPSGGGFTLTFPISEGDECLILFCDREIDNWYINGAGYPPTTGRLHDLTDAIALVGVRSLPRVLSGLSTTATQLRSDDGTAFVQVGAGKIIIEADEVVIHANTKLVYDADGVGTVLTGSTIDNYTQGITPTSHLPNPPEIPS